MMQANDIIVLEAFYSYGYQGREMIAVRAPFAIAAGASEIIDRRVRVGQQRFRILAVWRQIQGPIAAGEPIGIEVCKDPGAIVQIAQL